MATSSQQQTEPATQQPTTTPTSASVSSCAPLFKPTGDNIDIGWKWNSLKDKNNKKNVTCDFCLKTTSGGITRAKKHQMGMRGDVNACRKTPEDVKLILKAAFEEKKGAKEMYVEELHEDQDEEDEVEEITRLRRGKRPIASTPATAAKKANVKGPMDLMLLKRPEETIQLGKAKRQTSINDACEKEARARTIQYIARCFCRNGIPFNIVRSKSFIQMVHAIGNYGPHLKVPSYHEMRVPLVKKELEYTKELLKGHEEERMRYGCSIMSDGWTDRKGRTLINLLVNCSLGSMFVKSIDASSYMKTGPRIFDLLDSFVEEIGEKHVVQVVTDNGSNYVMAGKLLQTRREKLFWTPCAAHCLDLMLEDIGKIARVKKAIERGIKLVGYIYNHSLALNTMRKFTNKSELVRHGVTRFATTFLTLQRLHKQKANLRRMFTSDEWLNSKAAKDPKGKRAVDVVLMPSFWNDVVYTLKAMGPLVRVLRLVDNEKRPAMGYIYEAMDRAKEAIQKAFNGNEDKYREIFAIIDRRWECQLHHPLHAAGYYLNPEFYYSNPNIENDGEVSEGLYKCIERLSENAEIIDKIFSELAIYKRAGSVFGMASAVRQRTTVAPAEWWRIYGVRTPHLQNLAIKILSLTCSSSGCERNWSIFEHIHSKKRSRLEHQKLQDLVFIKYNQALKERFECRDTIDPIVLRDIDDSNEWLVGEMGEDAEDDLVFEDDTLTWKDVANASGAGEPLTYTRRQARLEKEKEKGAAPSSSRKGKGKAKKGKAKAKGKGKEVVEVVEEEEEDETTEDEEEFFNFNSSESEKEEEDENLEEDDSI